MNGMWGYKVVDQNYKSPETLIRYLVSTAGKGANLLLNIGPQPNGELPAAAIERLKVMGEWMRANGQTIYGTEAGDIKQQPWGVTTRKGDKLYVHIFELDAETLTLPLDVEVVEAVSFADRKAVPYTTTDEGVVLEVGRVADTVDYIVELTTK